MCAANLYESYQAYERQCAQAASVYRQLVLAGLVRSSWYGRSLVRLGDLLIRAGLKLKKRYATGQSAAWSAL